MRPLGVVVELQQGEMEALWRPIPFWMMVEAKEASSLWVVLVLVSLVSSLQTTWMIPTIANYSVVKRLKVFEGLRVLLLEVLEELRQAAEEPLGDLEQLLSSLGLKNMMIWFLRPCSRLQTFSVLAFPQQTVHRAGADQQTKLPYPLHHYCF